MPSKGPLKILGLHANSGSRFYRINPQFRWMKDQGHEIMLEPHDTQNLDAKIAWCDVLVLQMVFSEEIVAVAKKLGKKVIFECDDLVHKTHAKHYSYKETDTLWKQARWLWRIFRFLRKCDGFVCTTEELRRVYGWMCKRTLVFGNYMALEHWLKEPRKNLSDKVRILWAGSTSHTGDLEWVKPIMARILKKYPQAHFIYIGHGGVPTDDLYAKFIYGDDIFEGLPQDRRESMLAAPPNVFPYIIPALMADIAIAPLEKNYFNRFKSQCKYLEYGINGIPGVYAKWFYTDVRSPKDWDDLDLYHRTYGSALPYTGLTADTPEEWISAISLLIENATLRAQIGERAREEVIERYNFADHAPRWQGFVEMIGYGTTITHRTPTSQ